MNKLKKRLFDPEFKIAEERLYNKITDLNQSYSKLCEAVKTEVLTALKEKSAFIDSFSWTIENFEG